MKLSRLCVLLLVAAQCLLPMPVAAQTPIARAVFFFSPSCGHCHKVITEDLPILWDIYGGQIEVYYTPPTTPEEETNPAVLGVFGEQLQILYVNTSTLIGQELYGTASEYFAIPPEKQGVPLLVVGDAYLVGSIDIPEQFPILIANGIADGGIDWTDLPGLAEYISQLVVMPNPEPAQTPTEQGESTAEATQAMEATASPNATPPALPVDFNNNTPSFLSNFRRDPVGNSLSVIILVGMAFTLAAVVVKGSIQLNNHRRLKAIPRPRISQALPALMLGGIVVAAYLFFVESTGSQAVCGPVGDCNTVQQSEYAMLFGRIPIGGLGVFGYLALFLAWFVSRLNTRTLSNLSVLAMFGMAAFGTAFSLYLTFLEPFVIGATCAWCLTSALIMTTLMWLLLEPSTAAFSQLRRGRHK